MPFPSECNRLLDGYDMDKTCSEVEMYHYLYLNNINEWKKVFEDIFKYLDMWIRDLVKCRLSIVLNFKAYNYL